jgi:hypothetical protein
LFGTRLVHERDSLGKLVPADIRVAVQSPLVHFGAPAPSFFQGMAAFAIVERLRLKP